MAKEKFIKQDNIQKESHFNNVSQIWLIRLIKRGYLKGRRQSDINKDLEREART